MSKELKLGFLRLGRAVEDPVNLGVALVVGWAIVALTVTIALALSPGQALLLIFSGVALEERHPHFPSSA